MRFRTKAAITGIILALAGLAGAALSRGCEGGSSLGLISTGGGGGLVPSTPKAGKAASGELVITIEGERYLVDGSPRTLEEVVAAAVELSQNQVSQTSTSILVKKKGSARFMTVQKLEDELKRRNIRFRSENDY